MSRFVVRVAVGVLVGGSVLAFCVGEPGGQHTVTIRLVLPDDFKGIIKLVIDPTNGIDVISDSNNATVEIPPAGLVRIRSDALFHKWHVLVAEYQSGKRIPRSYDGVNRSDTVSLHAIGSGSSREYGEHSRWIKYYVGTREEWRSLSE